MRKNEDQPLARVSLFTWDNFFREPNDNIAKQVQLSTRKISLTNTWKNRLI